MNSIYNKMEWIWNRMKKTKTLNSEDSKTPLKKCLTTFDLTLLGIGNMTGSGIYVLTGTVMLDKAGPATFLSYLFAGITAFLNALCYAELGSKMPKSGSAYLYTYVAGGEFMAFIIGWSIILEYVLSISSVARGWSGTMDSLTKGAISNGTISTFGTFPASTGLANYPDFLSLGVIVFLTLIISTGPKLSAFFNSSITIINVFIILLATGIMISNPYKGSSFAPSDKGGFMPKGFGGIIAGAGTCFYAFIGFDAVTISSEEALNPQKSIPIANGISVAFVTLLFVISSAAIPIFVPWYKIDPATAFTSAFKFREINWAAYVTGIGSLFGISASLFTSIYALPRIVYSMASDGLLTKPLDYVYPKTQVPIIALSVFTLLAAILAIIFDIHTLADFLSIGTLIAYTIACANLLILRFKINGNIIFDESQISESDTEPLYANDTGQMKQQYKSYPILKYLTSTRVPNISIFLFIVFGSCFCSIIFNGFTSLESGYWWAWILLIIFFIGILLCFFLLTIFNQFDKFTTFKVPFVPFLPLMTILLNIVLIIKLSPMTWIRFVVWLTIGLIIYFGYGIRNSKENIDRQISETNQLAEYSNEIDNTPPKYESIAY